jgi:hypothetical protein
MALTVYCQEFDPDNTRCLSGYSVTIWSHDQSEVSSDDVQKLIQMICSEHLSGEMFIRTIHIRDCDTRRVHCSVQDLPPPFDLDLRFVSKKGQSTA